MIIINIVIIIIIRIVIIIIIIIAIKWLIFMTQKAWKFLLPLSLNNVQIQMCVKQSALILTANFAKKFKNKWANEF